MNSHVELVSRYFVREPRVDGFFDAYSYWRPTATVLAPGDPVLDDAENPTGQAASRSPVLARIDRVTDPGLDI